MNLLKHFYVNQPLEVLNEDNKQFYYSMIQDLDEKVIGITIPVNKGEKMLISVGGSCYFRLTTEKGPFLFESQVIKRSSRGNIPLYYVKVPSKVKHLQRREYFRLSCSLDASCLLLGKMLGDRPILEEGPWDSVETILQKKELLDLTREITRDCFYQFEGALPSHIIDISGGGCQLVLMEGNLPQHTFLALRTCLEEGRELVVRGKVVRCIKRDMTGVKVNEAYGVEFMGLKEKARDEIIEFIFNRSRRQ